VGIWVEFGLNFDLRFEFVFDGCVRIYVLHGVVGVYGSCLVRVGGRSGGCVAYRQGGGRPLMRSGYAVRGAVGCCH
jgi:hypothetical protein